MMKIKMTPDMQKLWDKIRDEQIALNRIYVEYQQFQNQMSRQEIDAVQNEIVEKEKKIDTLKSSIQNYDIIRKEQTGRSKPIMEKKKEEKEPEEDEGVDAELVPTTIEDLKMYRPEKAEIVEKAGYNSSKAVFDGIDDHAELLPGGTKNEG